MQSSSLIPSLILTRESAVSKIKKKLKTEIKTEKIPSLFFYTLQSRFYKHDTKVESTKSTKVDSTKKIENKNM